MRVGHPITPRGAWLPEGDGKVASEVAAFTGTARPQSSTVYTRPAMLEDGTRYRPLGTFCASTDSPPLLPDSLYLTMPDLRSGRAPSL